jgi:uncharacterized protein (DUF1800 family)
MGKADSVPTLLRSASLRKRFKDTDALPGARSIGNGRSARIEPAAAPCGSKRLSLLPPIGRGVAVAVLPLLLACASLSAASEPSPSAGQVEPVGAPGKTTRYAAARFLEQASFGPTTAEIERVRSLGVSAWIAEQMASPISQLDGSPVRVFDTDNPPHGVYQYVPDGFLNMALSSPDQLRLRVTWALSQFVVVSQNKGRPYGLAEYLNLLQRHAFGNYGDFLRAMTIHPAMGAYLDNGENRPESACTGCAPNENFARELMQLFTLGVYQLNGNGTIKRDQVGRPLETYTQDDVENLARALTGWEYAWVPNLPASDWGNFGQPMVATRSNLHDQGAKVVLGATFPAGRSANAELDAVVATLMQHPNIAPFVSLRLIQHLVTSDPTPEYVARVAAVFRDNGAGQSGDMKAVIKAVLLDADARRGDVPGQGSAQSGKVREPVLWQMALLRGLGCQRLITDANGNSATVWTQSPFNAPSVFSFYMPNDRAPGSGLLAPEQRLLSGSEFTRRLGSLSYLAKVVPQDVAAAGCQLEPLAAALAVSASRLADVLSARWFRGAMPPTLRASIVETAAATTWESGDVKAAMMLEFALISPYFGAIE